jgi:hypothetical protein
MKEDNMATTNTIRFYRNLTDWDLIVQVLHWNGPLHDQTSPEIAWAAYCLADGFGKLEGRVLRKIGWDWSHVRDSSEEGLGRIAEYLRRKLPEIVRAPIREDVIASRQARTGRR